MRSHLLRSGVKRPVFVGGKSTTSVTASGTQNLPTSSLTGGISSSLAAGDLLLFLNGTSDAAAATLGVPDTFTSIASLSANDTYDANLRLSYKIASGSEASIAFQRTGTSGYASFGLLYVWRNVSSTTPLDVTSTTATGTNTGLPNVPAITPATLGSVVIGFGVATNTATNSLASSDNFVITANVSLATAGTCGVNGIASAYPNWSSGAYDMAAFTGGASANTNSWAAVAVAIRPAR